MSPDEVETVSMRELLNSPLEFLLPMNTEPVESIQQRYTVPSSARYISGSLRFVDALSCSNSVIQLSIEES